MFSDDTKKLQQITVFFVLTVCFYGLSSSIPRGAIDATTVGCTRHLQRDWFAFYREPICLLETFVEKDRFQGTCYRAANWARVGETTGRGKYDRCNQRTEPVKAVWLYPLTRRFREELRG